MKRKKINRLSNQSGFSLIELMLAMSITIGLTGAIFYYLKQNQEAFVVQAALADTQQNFRAALDLLTRDIQSAGSNIPNFMGPIAGTNGASSAPDEILLIYGDSTFSSVTVNGPIANSTSTIDVLGSSLPTFTNGNNYILYSYTQKNNGGADLTADAAEFSIFKLSSQADITNGKRLTPTAPTNPDGSTITNAIPTSWANMSFPDNATLGLTKIDQWIRYRIDTANNELQRSVNGGAWIAVAHNITDMQIQYWVEYNNGTSYTQQTISDLGTASNNNRALIRAVILRLTATTS
ncbi:MAG TPA: prepilin-type N-terminal cleavage/methylation domain-containing protein, partial [Blastocatellia bacterium]|nr:prepilin-type N-terminal cleavage/methylation domain-containing protein [Blastocatellia bacterium]